MPAKHSTPINKIKFNGKNWTVMNRSHRHLSHKRTQNHDAHYNTKHSHNAKNNRKFHTKHNFNPNKSNFCRTNPVAYKNSSQGGNDHNFQTSFKIRNLLVGKPCT